MKLILFDIDETMLVAPEGANRDASQVMFKKVYGLDGVNEDFIENRGLTEVAIIKKVLEKVKASSGEKESSESETMEVPEQAHIVWANAAKEALKRNPARALPGIVEMLNQLSQRKDIVLGILSGNSYWRAEAKVESAGLDKFFRDSTGKLKGAFGNEAERRADLVDIAKNHLGNQNDKVILIDDSIVGAELARDLNIPAIMIATGKTSANKLSEYVDNVFPDFGENRWREAIEIIERF